MPTPKQWKHSSHAYGLKLQLKVCRLYFHMRQHCTYSAVTMGSVLWETRKNKGKEIKLIKRYFNRVVQKALQRMNFVYKIHRNPAPNILLKQYCMCKFSFRNLFSRTSVR